MCSLARGRVPPGSSSVVLWPSSLCVRLCPKSLLPMRTPAIGLGRTSIQDDLILSNYLCRDPFPNKATATSPEHQGPAVIQPTRPPGLWVMRLVARLRRALTRKAAAGTRTFCPHPHPGPVGVLGSQNSGRCEDRAVSLGVDLRGLGRLSAISSVEFGPWSPSNDRPLSIFTSSSWFRLPSLPEDQATLPLQKAL